MARPHCLQANATALKKRLSNLDLSETPAIIWKIALQTLLQTESEKVLPNMVFPPIWGKNGGVLSMHM